MVITENLDIHRVLRDLDMLKTERLPLGRHYVAKCDKHSRESYATMLAMLMLAGGSISETQSRLFKMLLTSLDLDGQQAALMARAPDLLQDDLREFLRLADENKLARSFFLDALVLSRLDAPLQEQQNQILSELADLLYLDEEELALVAMLAANVLRLPAVGAPFCLENFDAALFSVWDEFMFRPLDAQQLVAGVAPGLWLAETPLSLNAPWSLDNAHLRFVGKGRIDTKAAGHVRISNAMLERPLLSFSGTLELEMSSSTLSGEYQADQVCTALTLNQIGKASFSNLQVSTRQARSFLLLDSRASFDDCHFVECGNELKIGGAIAVREDTEEDPPRNIMVANSSFVGCQSLLGGAIRINNLRGNSISKSIFTRCLSKAVVENSTEDIKKGSSYKWDRDSIGNCAFSGGAIFADKSLTPGKCIVDCDFNHNSINIGDCYDGSGLTFVASSIFFRSLIGYSYPSNNKISDGSVSFDNGEGMNDYWPVDGKEILKEWSDYQ
jgi:hypothetical protein